MSFNANRPGQNQGAGAVDALFRQVFLTEVISAFNTRNVTASFFSSRPLTAGKSVSFPVTGRAGGGLHQVGTRLAGRKIKNGEIVIGVDGEYTSDLFLARIDEAKLHYNVRRPYVEQMGQFLARLFDLHNFLAVIKGARSSGNIPGETGTGIRLSSSGMATDAAVLAANIFEARAQLDVRGVPQDNVVCFLHPTQYNLLIQNKDTINKDYNGRGSYADGDIAAIAGIPIVKTTHIPNFDCRAANVNIEADFQTYMLTDQTSFENADGTYNVPAHLHLDCRTTVGVIAHRDAIGQVNLLGFGLDIDWIPDARGYLFVATQTRGVDVVRPEACVELATGPVAP